MPFWCYMLKCADGKYYTGHTDDLERRIAQHQYGGYCDFTSRRLPVTFVWCQEFTTRAEALESELRVKKWSRAKKEALAAGDWQRVSHFARPPGERVSTSLDTNGIGFATTSAGSPPC
ncbi:excinuclease ABC subunit C [Erythrobacter sp. QSSC1-22B]|uniref:GIY-YIG nuclease family protein n=1 Tax=Erythrobacter sp. QSSC1-22B TaxID=1860125 RepID=UPI000804E459|nr:GIY-YIG nuclease family protein [Erythrobacter sp. QSSC1-22B]OBX18390.1 excinuclease ABC subunit C [Erythrobacter sp. QSSC1-22B]